MRIKTTLVRRTQQNFYCSQQYAYKTLKSIGIKAWKNEKSTSYAEAKVKTMKSYCFWMVGKFKGKSLFSDDEVTLAFPNLR